MPADNITNYFFRMVVGIDIDGVDEERQRRLTER
jgi:hypothetical protein